MPAQPRLLLATTTWWPSLAILASAFEQAGFAVTMLCPRGHIAWYARQVACRELDRRRPNESLVSAIETLAPVLIVPGDERVVQMLRDLHDARPPWRAMIETAIGARRSHGLLTARVSLLHAAPAAGFTVPATQAIQSEADLDAWMDRVPAPWVLKVDGAWGGEGVRIVDRRGAAHRAFQSLRRGVSSGLALRRMIVNGDPFLWQDRRMHRQSTISAQAFVPGQPGNCAIFALAGRLLGATVVEAVETCGARGPSTLVRTIDRPDLVECASRLVAQCGLSGFFGFDVILDHAGRAALIEMNPRVTAPCRILGRSAPSPIAAAAAAFGAVPRRNGPETARGLFASFPLAWLTNPFSPALAACNDDLPWHEPEMLREALRPLWPERGLLASLPARVRVLGDRLRGRPAVDYRRRSFAWWLEEARLGHATARDAPASPGRANPRARALPDLGATEAETGQA